MSSFFTALTQGNLGPEDTAHTRLPSEPKLVTGNHKFGTNLLTGVCWKNVELVVTGAMV